MKLFYFLSLLLFVFLLSSYEITQKQDDDGCKGAIGDIKYSYLDEGLFRKQNGDCWVALEGQQLDRNSKLYNVLRFDGKSPDNIPQNLPDANGMFIRSMGDKGRTIGSFQKFSTAMPSNKFKTTKGGSHAHGFKDTHPHDWKHPPRRNEDLEVPGGDKHAQIESKKTTDQSGNHSHTISGGDSETRPDNITFYTYIRIN